MIRKALHSLLLAYTTNTLHPLSRNLVSWWLSLDQTAQEECQNLMAVRNAVKAQPVVPPTPDMWKRIQMNVKTVSTPITPVASLSPIFWKSWVLGMALIGLSLILLWYVLPPGVTLQWTASGEGPVAFRVYRAISPSNQFELLDEISATTRITTMDVRVYTYRDIILLPGQEYIYRVEMIDRNGQTFSQTTVSNARQALPGQLALLISLFIILYGMSLVFPKTYYLFSRA